MLFKIKGIFSKEHNRYKTKNNHGKLISLLFACFIVMLSIANAAMNGEISVSGDAVFRVEKDIRITNLMYDNENSNNALDGYHQYSADTFKYEVILLKYTI